MITTVIPVSPIASHPETAILEETVASVRHWLPDGEIILTFDGVRREQRERRDDYEEHIRRVLWMADRDWGNVVPFVFDTHQHQTGMMRAVIGEIRTPLLMYVEADTPLVTDEPIDWEAVTGILESGVSNSVRFHHEAVIPEPHTHMMHGFDYDGENLNVPFLRTSQYSQRPHVAPVAFYRRILEQFTPDAKSFIEDRMYGVVRKAQNADGMHGWNQWRLHIYAPQGGNYKRSYHLDGRAGEPKYSQAF